MFTPSVTLYWKDKVSKKLLLLWIPKSLSLMIQANGEPCLTLYLPYIYLIFTLYIELSFFKTNEQTRPPLFIFLSLLLQFTCRIQRIIRKYWPEGVLNVKWPLGWYTHKLFPGSCLKLCFALLFCFTFYFIKSSDVVSNDMFGCSSFLQISSKDINIGSDLN